MPDDDLMVRVRDMLDEGAAPITLAELGEARLSDAAHAPHRRRVLLAVAAVIVVGCVAVGGFLVLPGDSSKKSGRVSSASGLTTFDNASRKASVEYPEGWQVARKGLTPALGAPGKSNEVAALGTFALEPSDHNCAQLPVNALEALTATDAFVWISENFQFPPGTYPPRPATITPADGIEATSPSIFDTPPAGCLDHQLAGTVRTFRFEDHGRNMYVHVALGSNASPERVTQAYGILNSLVVR